MTFSIYLCINSEKSEANTVVETITSQASELDIVILKTPSKAEAIISIGGDGTYLYASHLAIENQIPLAGINLGRFGFLPSFATSETKKVLEYLKQGKTHLVQKSLISVQCLDTETVVANEVVIERARADRAVRLEVGIAPLGEDPQSFVTFVCDGLIVATPMGSTAYASSAGGPILADELRAMVMTFVALHHPKIAPIVFDPEKHVVVKTQEEAILSCDGKCIMELEANTVIDVGASRKTLTVCEIQPSILVRATRQDG